MSGIEDRRNDNREEPESVLDVIQRKHSISLLKYLDERGEVMVSDVQRDMEGTWTRCWTTTRGSG